MNIQDKQFWEKIKQFSFDTIGASFPFSARLMRENGWTEEYTLEVIEEYKKFMFLVCVTDHPVSPSDPVDQVWHLHLVYTKSYWDEFCHGVLGRAVHHNPTKGGQEERKKHKGMYNQTAESYQQYFGKPQPAHIWMSTQDLFKDFHYERVNMHRNWVISKPSFVRKRWHFAPLLLLLGLLFMANDGGLGIMIMIIFVVIVVIVSIGGSGGGNKGGRNGSSGGGGWFVGCGSDSGGDSGSSGCSSCSGCGGCGGCG